jgi:hypothetical protein
MSPFADAIINDVFPLLSQMLIFEYLIKYSIAYVYLRNIASINGLSPSSFL